MLSLWRTLCMVPQLSGDSKGNNVNQCNLGITHVEITLPSHFHTQKHVCLYVKCLLLLSIFNQNLNMLPDYSKTPPLVKFCENVCMPTPTHTNTHTRTHTRTHAHTRISNFHHSVHTKDLRNILKISYANDN
jgi:hypothetical protein